MEGTGMSDFVNKPGRGNASKMKPEWLQKDFEELKAKNFDWFNKMSEAEQKDFIPKYKGEIVLNVPEGMSGDVQRPAIPIRLQRQSSRSGGR
jgi:hypothetical protein